VWLVNSYDALRELTRADKVHWDSPEHPHTPGYEAFGIPLETWTEYVGGPRILQQSVGEVHNRLHRWWMRALSPKVLKRWGDELIDPVVSAGLDAIVSRGKADLSGEFLETAVLKAQFSVLGVPTDDEWRGRFSALADGLLAIFGSQMLHLDLARNAAAPEDVEVSMAASSRIRAMAAEVALAKKPSNGSAIAAEDVPGIDFIGLLWRGGEDLFEGEPSLLDVVGHAWIGITSVESALAGVQGMTYLLLKHPELHDLIRSDERAADNFVEEAVRLCGSNEFRTRRAKHDLQLGGVTIKQGQVAVAMVAAANRDPEHYSHPLDVDLYRSGPRDHVGFFQGPRSCVGIGMARLLLQRFSRGILTRLDDLRLDPDAEPPQFTGSQLRHWRPLNAVFTERQTER